MKPAKPENAIGRRLLELDYFIISDIDNTLIGKDNTHLNALMKIIKDNRQRIGFGVATAPHQRVGPGNFKTV